MISTSDELSLLQQALESYDHKYIAEYLNQVSPGTWTRDSLKRWLSGKDDLRFSEAEFTHLQDLLPKPPKRKSYDFDFIDLFAGIGGIRKGFEEAGGRCVFTSEWNPYAVRTYKANHYSDPLSHAFNSDIREVTLSANPDISEDQAYQFIDANVPVLICSEI